MDDAEVPLLTGLVEEAGGHDWAWNEARRRLEIAWEHIARSISNPAARAAIEGLTTTLVTRRH